MVDDWNDEYIGSVAEDTTLPDGPESVQVHASQTRLQVLWDTLSEGDSGSSDLSPDWDDDYIGEDWDEVVIEGGSTIAADLSFVPPTASQSQDILGFDVEPDEEIDYFQVQVATDSAFQHVIRHDRMVKGHNRTWRISRPSSTVFYARVRSVDILGNKSDWVSSDDSNAYPCQPYPPNVKMKELDSGNFRANLNYINDASLSPGGDETISRFQFAIRQLEWTRLTADVTAGAATIHVQEYDPDEVPQVFPFTIFVQEEQMSVTSITGGGSLVWHVTRGINSTTAASHATGKIVYYFGRGLSATNQMVILDDTEARTYAGFNVGEPKTRWKAKIRCIDSQNRKSFWSDWTPVVKAAVGASYDNGDTLGGTGSCGGDPDVDPVPPVVDPPAPVEVVGDPPVIETFWPHERIIRFEMDVSDGFVSDPATGFNAIVTSARATVDVAPSTETAVVTSKTDDYIPGNPADTTTGLPPIDDNDLFTLQRTVTPASGGATVDVNLNGSSFFALTIPMNDPKNQSDLTWITPPLRIGSQTGLLIASTDLITVTQTDMQDAAGTLTVYLMIYLV